MFPVFFNGCSAYTFQFTPGKGRFQHIGGIHGTFGSACAHKGVHFVYKENNLTVGICYLLEHGLEPVFKFPTVFCAGDQGSHIQCHHPFVFQGFRDIALYNPLCQTLHNGGLAHARLANQDRIVLGPSGKDLDDSPDFIITADDRVQIAF